MPYQFSVWLDDKTARDLESLSRFEERKRGAMVKVLIRRAARQLAQAEAPAPVAQPAEDPKQEGAHVPV
jgi:hypothetical protein